MPGRSLIVYAKWSGDSVQLSASHGSSVSVARLTETSGACVRSASASPAVLGSTRRLYVAGSVRIEAINSPPRDGFAFLSTLGTPDEGAGFSDRHPARDRAATTAAAVAEIASFPATDDLTGQWIGRYEKR